MSKTAKKEHGARGYCEDCGKWRKCKRIKIFANAQDAEVNKFQYLFFCSECEGQIEEI